MELSSSDSQSDEDSIGTSPLPFTSSEANEAGDKDNDQRSYPSRQASLKYRNGNSLPPQLKEPMDAKAELIPLEREYASLRQQLRERIREVSLLRRGLKNSDQLIKEQSSELRDLKKQYLRLHEVSMQKALVQDTPYGGT